VAAAIMCALPMCEREIASWNEANDEAKDDMPVPLITGCDQTEIGFCKCQPKRNASSKRDAVWPFHSHSPAQDHSFDVVRRRTNCRPLLLRLRRVEPNTRERGEGY